VNFLNINIKNRFISIRNLIISLVLVSSCSQYNPNDYTQRPLRILFIGNSLTHYNGGLDFFLKKMFAKSNPQMMIYAEKIAPGGERLSGHFSKGKALKKIKEKEWDIVVLQEYSNGPIINKEDFYKYSKIFVRESRRTGAKPIFYMTFSYKDNDDMTSLLSSSYLSVAKELKCEVVPVGIAWQKVIKNRKDINMYTDFKHPSKYGTYLAAAMFYSFLTNKPPSNSEFDYNIEPEILVYLQNTAWETVNNWKSNYGK